MRKINITKKKFATLVVLIFSFLILTLIYINGVTSITIFQTNLGQEAFSVVNKNMGEPIFVNAGSGELLKGEKLQGKFVADDNYLGQVLVRFYNFGRINPDSVIFRIKEEGQNNWYYEYVYKTNQFQPNMFFTFGFPIINNSKGKTYVFEVESLNGITEHSIGLSAVKPLGAVLYQYPKKLLLSNPEALIKFIVNNKIKKIPVNVQTFVGFGIYLNFIIVSLFLIYLLVDYLMENKIRIWFEIKSSDVIMYSIILLVLSAIILYLKKPELSYSLSTLSYFILIIGVIYLIIESKRE